MQQAQRSGAAAITCSKVSSTSSRCCSRSAECLIRTCEQRDNPRFGEWNCSCRKEGERRMYYRVAIQGDPSLTWQWKSTPLSSLNTLLQWLQFYRAFPKDRLRMPTASVAIESTSNERSWGSYTLDERGSSSLEKRRVELERGGGGDYDLPYRFTLPASTMQVLVWMKLLVRVQDGTLPS